MAGRDDHDLPALEDLVRRPALIARAACRGVPVDDSFFPARAAT
jgi:hypothetical protein